MFDTKRVLFIGMVEVGSGIHRVLHTYRCMLEKEVALSERFFCALFLTVFFTQLILLAIH